jgi:26S proteasome regulatory subunit N3
MDHGTSEQPIQHRSSRKTAVLPELETFLHLLIVVRTIDNENIDKAKICNTELIDKLIKYNRRSLDAICSRAYFYQSMIFELQGQLHVLRSFLHSRLRTATLHYDEESQAVLLNLLLRNYLHYNLCDQVGGIMMLSIIP